MNCLMISLRTTFGMLVQEQLQMMGWPSLWSLQIEWMLLCLLDFTGITEAVTSVSSLTLMDS